MNSWREWLVDRKLLFIGGVLLGIIVGIVAGWVVWPVSYYDTDLYDLHADYQDDFVVMVGALYAMEQDVGEARQLLELLPNPETPHSIEGIVVDVTERYIAQGANPNDIGYLVRLADALGTITTPMQPYLTQLRQ
jgi:hypothetical protein